MTITLFKAPRSTCRQRQQQNKPCLIQPSTQFLNPIFPSTPPSPPYLPLQTAYISEKLPHVISKFCTSFKTDVFCGSPGYIRAPGRPPGVVPHVRVPFFGSLPLNVPLTRWNFDRTDSKFWPRRYFFVDSYLLPCNSLIMLRAPGRPPGVILRLRASLILRTTLIVPNLRWILGRAVSNCWSRCCLLAEFSHHYLSLTNSKLRDFSAAPSPQEEIIYLLVSHCLECNLRSSVYHPTQFPHVSSSTKLVKFIAELFLSKFSFLIPNMISTSHTSGSKGCRSIYRRKPFHQPCCHRSLQATDWSIGEPQ